jgi:DNA-binding NarL/FixJ family response regulator
MARAVKPEVVVLDLSMPGMSGLQAAEVLQRDCPQIRVVALSMHAEEGYQHELLQLKVVGYVVKRSAGAQLLQAIRKVAGGGVWFDRALASRALCAESSKRAASGSKRCAVLTRKEEVVVRLIALGYTNKEIAAKLAFSPKSVERYKSRFAQKLGLHGRAEIVRYALRRGWLEEEEAIPSAVDTAKSSGE